MRFWVLLLFLPSAFALTPIDAGEMEATVYITNTITFVQTGPQFEVSEAEGILHWYPRESYLQDVIEIDTDVTSEGMTFTWKAPKNSETFAVEATINTRNAIVPVRERIMFPIQDIPPDVRLYLQPGEITDETSSIRRTAQELVRDTDDAYEAVFRIADWTTTNIEYNLASLREPAIQKASEVLESRWGKCDEMTALFISMVRAIGIPARFVAGYSYTNSELFSESWGGHGWAEVWLPDVGWVPFDVTYGEYGYLDAGHVQLQTSPDAKETSVDYSARGSAFRLETEPLGIYITPKELSEKKEDILDITLHAPYDEVGFGSAVLIVAEIQNLKEYYVSTRLDISHTTNTEFFSETYANVLVKPRGLVTVPFLVKIDENLERGYRYEFPFSVTSRIGEQAKIVIDVRQNSPVYDKSAFSQVIASYEEEEPASAVTITCERGNPAYTGKEIVHVCSLYSEEDIPDTLTVCSSSCTTAAVEGNKFVLSSTFGKAGVYTETYRTTVYGEEVSFFVTSSVLDPTLLAHTVSHADSTIPDDTLDVSLLLDYSGARPKNVEIVLDSTRGSATKHIEDLDPNTSVQFVIPGSVLRSGENELKFVVKYTDELGTYRQDEFTSSVTLTGVSFFDRVQFFFEDLGYWLTSWA